MRFKVTLKPTGMAKKLGRIRPEFLLDCEASNKEEAVRVARIEAEANGFRGYAVTDVKQVTK